MIQYSIKPNNQTDLERANGIIKVVCEYFSIKDLMIRCRKPELVYARQLAIFLIKRDTGLHLREIGRLFAGRDHTTIMHAINVLKGYIKVYSETKKDIDNIKAKLLCL